MLAIVRLGLERVVVIGRVGNATVALKIAGARAFIFRERLGPGGGCYRRQLVLFKEKESKIF